MARSIVEPGDVWEPEMIRDGKTMESTETKLSPQEKIALARETYAALNAGDIEKGLEGFSEDLVPGALWRRLGMAKMKMASEGDKIKQLVGLLPITPRRLAWSL